MKYIAFGNSGITLSRMGLGLAALGRPGYINLGHQADLPQGHDEQEMLAQTHRMLDYALELGITYLDVAQSYGKGEAFLSQWLRQAKPEKVTVGSKWGYYYTAGWTVDAEKHEIKDHSLDRLDAQWPESRERLDPYLKLYQIHSATFESGVLENRAVLKRLESIRSEGYLIGLSLSGVQQADVLREALKVQIGHQPLFGAVQATYNVLEQSAGDVLQQASDAGLGVIIKEGVANGRLTSRNTDPALEPLRQIARKYATSEDAVALAFILYQPFAHVVLSGAAIPEHLRSNCSALDLELTDADLKMLSAMRQSSTSYWQARSEMAWN